jgi:hypothetical protein
MGGSAGTRAACRFTPLDTARIGYQAALTAEAPDDGVQWALDCSHEETRQLMSQVWLPGTGQVGHGVNTPLSVPYNHIRWG